MSLSSEKNITCPKCGLAQPCTLWDSVNVTANPELKQRILQRELNQFICRACGHRAILAKNLLYHDMEQKLMLWLVPTDEGQPGTSMDLDLKQLPQLENYIMRQVGKYNALLEKIRIFEDKQNDCFVELLKLIIELQSKKLGQKRLFYGGLREIGDEEPEFEILFLELVQEGPPMEYSLNLTEMKSILFERFPQETFQPVLTDKWPIIDRKFASRCLEEAAL